MNRFVRLGDVILNMDHIIEIRRHPAEKVLWITTTEIDNTGTSRVLGFRGEISDAIWKFFLCVLDEVTASSCEF